jgi:hypothetical protein
VSMKKYYKYKSLKNLDHVLDVLTNTRLYCSKYCDLNDPFEGEFQAQFLSSIKHGKYINTDKVPVFYTKGDWSKLKDQGRRGGCIKFLQEKYFICSLAKNFSSIPLWAYYADSYYGICIEVVPRDNSDFTDVIYDVDYSMCSFDPKEIYVKPDEASIDRQIRKSLTHKVLHWELEDEVRLLWQESYYYDIYPVQKVYCGSRITDSHYDLLTKLFPDIKFIKTRISDMRPEVIANE